ncbi:MAG: hypothetical protein RJA07_2642 [Bacteroidota bacterium]|jgi:hypothetical protein
MKKNLFGLFVLIVAFCSTIQAQDDADVLRYSQLQSGGTARSFSLAGATGALGGDFSNASNNPSGLALYRSSEFTFSPSINFSKTNATYFNVENSDRLTRFGLGNIGLVFKNNYTIKGKEVTSGWTGITFAFGINKLASFNNATTYSAFNNYSSIGDKYAYDLSMKGVGPRSALSSDPWSSGLAYDAFLLDANSTTDTTHYTAVSAGGKVNQTMNKVVKGAANEMVISFAGNYNNKLMIGGTLGVPFINYMNETAYYESDDSLYHSKFKNYSSISSIKASGTGINLKLGAMYLVNDVIRLGVALHTPTYYNIHDEGTITMTTERKDSANAGIKNSSTSNTINYSITTPWRAIGSAAFLFKKYGFITIDYEFVDYSSGNIHFNSTDAADIQAASNINRTLRNNYTTASNIKIGGELKLDIFSIRAGYAMYGSPYKTATVKGFDETRNVVSLGFGIRDKDYFFDMGIQKTMYKNIDIPYLQTNATSYAATLQNTNTMVVATLGLKF